MSTVAETRGVCLWTPEDKEEDHHGLEETLDDRHLPYLYGDRGVM